MTEVWTEQGTQTQVTIKVNGVIEDTIDPSGRTVGEVAREYAQEHGLRSFSVLADGRRVNTEEAGQSFEGVSTLELVAKDARG